MTCWDPLHATLHRTLRAAPLACLQNVMHVSQAAAGAGSGGHTTETLYNARNSDWAQQHGGGRLPVGVAGKQPESCRFASARWPLQDTVAAVHWC